MNDIRTYRELLESEDVLELNEKLYIFLNTLRKICNRGEGYIYHISRGLNPRKCEDVIKAVLRILDSETALVNKNDDYAKVHILCSLVLKHIDDEVREHDFVSYSTELNTFDENYPYLSKNMLDLLESQISFLNCTQG